MVKVVFKEFILILYCFISAIALDGDITFPLFFLLLMQIPIWVKYSEDKAGGKL